MRKFLISLGLMIASMIAIVPVVSAQDSASVGCSTADAVTDTLVPFELTAEFTEGEILAITVSGLGEFTVTVDGTDILSGGADGDNVSYTVASDGSVTLVVSVANGDTTSVVSINCTEAEEPFDGTLCHYPPGNPDAAHTIRVGSQNAVDAHVRNHGDTLGACPEGVQTRQDIPSVNVTIFVIYASDSIQVYGDCDEECEEVLNVPITLIIDFDVIIINLGGDEDSDDETSGGEFVEVENPEDYGFAIGEVTIDGLVAVIYYLHPDPEDPTVGVFQINVYDSGTLIDDSVLVFISSTGNIIFWTDQNYWDEQLSESMENDA